MGSRGKKIDFNLYLITDRKQTAGRDLLDVLESALKGGVKAAQLREKDLSGKELFELAKKLRILTKKYNAKLFINDRVDIAIAVEADGVHLGKNSFSAKEAKKVLNELTPPPSPSPACGGGKGWGDASRFLIGASTHSLKEALDAEKSGADFITFGPVFYTKSKAKYGKPLGIERLKEAAKAVQMPVFAIGGIKLNNAKEVMKTGVQGVAMISEVIKAKNPEVVVSNLLEEIR